MREIRKTLTRYTIEEEHKHPGATGQFSGLLNSVATSIKIISNHVNKGALVRPAGATGESVGQKLDDMSNEVMLQENEWTGHVCGMASEELPDVFHIPRHYKLGKYLLLFDALDGLSNVDVNLTVGTLFSILRSPRPGEDAQLEDFLQPGVEQVCGGFALYGPSTMLVLTTGDGVDGFTLDRDIGAFILTHPKMTIPADGREFAINASNERFWEPPVKRYVSECLAGQTGPRKKDFSMRWIASLVAETFRILTRGGIFMYPRYYKGGDRPGRRRLMFEANPVAFVIEQAGGAASTGRQRVMEVKPESLDQRVPLIFGSKNEVERIVRYHQEFDTGTDKEYSSPLFGSRSLFMNEVEL